jgi:alpha-1,2-mannosyltransferase
MTTTRDLHLSQVLRGALTKLVLGVLPLVMTVGLLVSAYVDGPFLYDFNGDLYEAGTAIVNGRNPYHPAYVERQAALKRAGRPGASVISTPVYPPPVLLAATPFTRLPYHAAGALFALLSIAGFIGGLYLLGVRDWRCFGVAFASWPVLHGLLLGALTPLFVLGVGVAWRQRYRSRAPALGVAAIVTAKLFPWPLGIWLLITRRFRAAALAACLVIAVTLASWAVIDFAGMSTYPQMLSDLNYLCASAGVSVVAGLLHLGVGATLAQLAAAAAAVAVLAGAWLLCRSRGAADADRYVLSLAVLAALLASPISWPHYFALAFVPIALFSPRLSALWFIPLIAWLAPIAQSTEHPWAILPYLAISAVLLLYVADRARAPRDRVAADGRNRSLVPADAGPVAAGSTP